MVMENGKLQKKCYNAREVQWPPEKNTGDHFWPPWQWLYCIETNIYYNMGTYWTYWDIDGEPMTFYDIDWESYYHLGDQVPDSCSHTYQRFMNGYNPNSDTGL